MFALFWAGTLLLLEGTWITNGPISCHSINEQTNNKRLAKHKELVLIVALASAAPIGWYPRYMPKRVIRRPNKLDQTEPKLSTDWK